MMTIQTLIAIALSFSIALVISWALVLPFFQSTAKRRGVAEKDQLLIDALDRKERVIQALEDLEQDFLAKKLSDEDYRQSKSELVEEAVASVALIERLDTAIESEPPVVRRAAA